MPRFVPMGISDLSEAGPQVETLGQDARPGAGGGGGLAGAVPVNTWRHHRYRGTRSVSSICTPERTVGGHVTNGAANASV